MRVLLTTDTIGGVWTFTETLARGLMEEGHAVGLLSLGRLPSAAQTDAVSRLCRDFGADFYFQACTAPLEWMEDNTQSWTAGSEAIHRMLQRFAPDLLHTSQLCFGRLGADLPVLITAHSDVLSWAEATLAPDGMTHLEQTASPEWLETYRRLVTEGLEQASAVVAPTHWLATALHRLYPLHRLPGVIHNGIAPFAPATQPRRLQAVTAGRFWDKGKGLAILNGLCAPMPVLIAGEQPPGQVEAPRNATFLGCMPHSDLQEIFHQSALYLATSIYEPFGLAPLEAAQAGCAVVARDIPSFREIWADAAFYFHSPATLEAILLSLAADPDRLQAAQCRAVQRASRYTASLMTSRYLSLYQELLTTDSIADGATLTHA